MAKEPKDTKLSFKDFHDTEYKPGEDESVNYRAYKRKRTNESIGETVAPKRITTVDVDQKKRDLKFARMDKKIRDLKKESSYSLDDILTILGERYVAKSIANKRKASIRMKVGKVKHKAALGKRRAMRRMANQDVLKRRSRKQEWRNAFKKLAKGKKKSDMSIAQVRSIEKKLERPVWQRIVNRKSVIGVKDKRRLEIARKKGTWKK